MILLVNKFLELLMVYVGIREDCGMDVETKLLESMVLTILD